MHMHVEVMHNRVDVVNELVKKNRIFRKTRYSTLSFFRGRPRGLLGQHTCSSLPSAGILLTIMFFRTFFRIFAPNKYFRSFSSEATFSSTSICVMTRSVFISATICCIWSLCSASISLITRSNFLTNLLSFSGERTGQFSWQFCKIRSGFQGHNPTWANVFRSTLASKAFVSAW